jgi:hypothetical protein
VLPSGPNSGELTQSARGLRIAARLIQRKKGVDVSWSLKGSYFETCSCDLMCPCNLSFDHGATYDYCRVTLVFDIADGEIEGTDVSGLKVAAIADTPKVMTEGTQPARFDGMFHPVASNLTMAEAKRSSINAFGIAYEGKSGLSTSEFSWAA